MEDYNDLMEDGFPMLSAFLINRPFGIQFSFTNMEKFLKIRGYTILERTSVETGELYHIAVKPGETKTLPKTGNIIVTFNQEVEEVLLNWLIKHGSNCQDSEQVEKSN